VFVAIGAAMLYCFYSMTGLEHFTRQAHTYLTFFFIAFFLYVIATGLILWKPARHPKTNLIIIAVFTVLFRITLWFTEPTLSTDVWRYIWDGRLASNGVNPYAERVDSETLDYLETPLRERVEHQWMASPYPPAAIVMFGGIYTSSPENPLAMQVAFTLFDLACAGVIVLILQQLHQPLERVLLYTWNPLIVVEFAHGAHLDSMMTLFVLLALYASLRGQQTWSMVTLAIATLTKLIPILLLPVFIRRWGVWRTLAFGIIVVAAFAPFTGAGLGLTEASDGTGIFGALRIYTSFWKTNDGLFYWLVKALESFSVPHALNIGKTVGLLPLGVFGLWILVRGEDAPPEQIILNCALLMSIYTLFQAAVFPWYLAWLVALIPLLPLNKSLSIGPFVAGWIYFSAAVNLSYLFYRNPAQPLEIEWVRRVEYLPLFGFLLIALVIYLWRRSKPVPQTA